MLVTDARTRSNIMNEVLTGLVLHDSTTGKAAVFELLRRDALNVMTVAISFCAQHMADMRAICKQKIKEHLLAAGHIRESAPKSSADRARTGT